MNKEINDNIKVFQRVFKSQDGQKVLEDLEKRCGVHVTSFSKDSHETAFREGQRSVVLFIKSTLSKQPKELINE
jgi:hypothetical protein